MTLAHSPHNPWTLLTLVMLLVGLGLQVVYGFSRTQQDPRRELRKF